MNAKAQHRLTPALVVLALVLTAVWFALLAGFGQGVRWHAPRTPASLPAARTLAAAPTVHPVAEFAPVWQQSLFSPNRKPEAHAANGGSALGDLQLTGVIITPRWHMALLHDKTSGRELRLHQGERMPGVDVTVVEVLPRSVIIDSAQGRTELKLPAGAPIDVAKGAPDARGAPPPPAPSSSAPSVPGAASMQRVTPAIGQDAPRPSPPPAYSAQQLERLRKLKAAVLQRRAADAATTPEGAQ